MILPEGTQVVKWCSMFCKGNEATGDLSVQMPSGQWITVPICDYCKDHIEKNSGKSLDNLLLDRV